MIKVDPDGVEPSSVSYELTASTDKLRVHNDDNVKGGYQVDTR